MPLRDFPAANLPGLQAGRLLECRCCQPDPVWLNQARRTEHESKSRLELSERFFVGDGDLSLSDRGGRQRRQPRPVDLGPFRPNARHDLRSQQRRHRGQPFSPVQGGHSVDEGAGSQGLSILDRVAACLPGRNRFADPKGLDFYNRLLDELSANGIEPFATLYNWDLPLALQDRHAGWTSRETSKAFADYAAHVAGRLGDRVKHFFTINECSRLVHLGHGLGADAPELKLSPSELNRSGTT